MAEFKISVDLSQVAAAAPAMIGQIFPLLTQAVRAVANQTQANWIEAVLRARLWSGEKKPYAASITAAMTGPFSAVVSSEYKYAEEIETGRPPKDLKAMLGTSMKVRRTKSGKRFLVIPFRHNTPGNDALAPDMPADVYAQASQLSASSIVAQGQRPSGEVTALSTRGMRPLKAQTPYLSNPLTRSASTVTRNVYKWGGKLSAAGVAKNYAGMYRFNTSSPGGNASSQFLTFRIMMEGSSGWIVPAKPGLYIAKGVADAMQPLAESAFAEAIKRTID